MPAVEIKIFTPEIQKIFDNYRDSHSLRLENPIKDTTGEVEQIDISRLINGLNIRNVRLPESTLFHPKSNPQETIKITLKTGYELFSIKKSAVKGAGDTEEKLPMKKFAEYEPDIINAIETAFQELQ